MKSPRYLEKPPKWADDDYDLDEPATFGGTQEYAPRLPTRLLPIEDEYLVPASVLNDILDRTQYMVYLAAEVAAHGTSPELHDIRGIDKTLRHAATLKISPFGVGSFIVPAEFAIRDVVVDGEKGAKSVSTADIVNTFADLMGQLSDQDGNKANSLPIGLIQAVEEIGKSVNKHLKKIEYSASTELVPEGSKVVSVDTPFVNHATEVLRRRRGRSQSGFATVAGELVSLDLIGKRAKIRYTHKSGRTMITNGFFDSDMSEPLIRLMAKEVSVFGPATYDKDRIKTIQIMHIDVEEKRNLDD